MFPFCGYKPEFNLLLPVLASHFQMHRCIHFCGSFGLPSQDSYMCAFLSVWIMHESVFVHACVFLCCVYIQGVFFYVCSVCPSGFVFMAVCLLCRHFRLLFLAGKLQTYIKTTDFQLS